MEQNMNRIVMDKQKNLALLVYAQDDEKVKTFYYRILALCEEEGLTVRQVYAVAEALKEEVRHTEEKQIEKCRASAFNCR